MARVHTQEVYVLSKNQQDFMHVHGTYDFIIFLSSFLQVHFFSRFMYKFFICYHVSTHGFDSFIDDTLLMYSFNSFVFHYDSLIHVLYSSIDDSSVASRQN